MEIEEIKTYINKRIGELAGNTLEEKRVDELNKLLDFIGVGEK